MNFESFKSSLADDMPVPSMNVYLQALWYVGKNEWERAHTIVQDLEDKTAAWIHAYLHRKEGDNGNAGYWYNRAGKKMPGCSVEKEWEEIVSTLL